MHGLLRIGQVSKLYGISIDTLRHYDKKGLLKPIIHDQNDYRYYALEHLDILEMILVGKYMEIPLNQMKEIIDSENIHGYLSMINKQKELINEKKRLLDQLDQYTENMEKLLTTISNFKNDYTFSTASSWKELDLTIYRVDFEKLLNDSTKSQKTVGVESFEQWGFYHSKSDGTIIEDEELVGFSFPPSVINTDIFQEKIKSASENKLISPYHVAGHYEKIMFWGIKSDLMDYLYKLCSHFGLKNSNILVKYKFALLHKNMDHEYFVEIFFPKNSV